MGIIKKFFRNRRVNKILKNYRVTPKAESAYYYCKDIILGNNFGVVADYEELLEIVGNEFNQTDRKIQAELFCTLVDMINKANGSKRKL